MKRTRGYYFAFKAGALAGLVALIFSFILFLGNVGPFIPETANQAFIKIVPAWLEEPMIHSLGYFADLFGVIIATIVTIIIYGIFGIIFDRAYSPWTDKLGKINRSEQFLLYSIFPWLFFGILVLPLLGTSIFGISANASIFSPYEAYLFHLGFLVAQLLFGIALASGYKAAGVFEHFPTKVEAHHETVAVSNERRTFIERSVVFGA